MAGARLGGWAVGALLAVALVGAPAGAAAPPHAVITASPPAESFDTTATFSFESSGPVLLAQFECRLDGAAWKQCTSPTKVDGLTGGRHRFEVRLTGVFADPVPDVRSWIVAVRTEIAPEPLPPTVSRPPPARSPVRRDIRGCPYGQNRPGEASDAVLERALTCLVNYERATRGFKRLRARGSLALAAAHHARDMVNRHYFAHRSLAGESVADRARRTGYLRGTDWWTVGEVLAWGRPAMSAHGTVRAWMRSRPHRAVLLGPNFRDIGISIAHGSPEGSRGATAVGVLGRRG